DPGIAQAEADQDFAVLFDSVLVLLDEFNGLRAADAAIKPGVVDVIGRPVQCRNVAGPERRTVLGTDFADAVQIADAIGVQIEIFRHGVSPNKKRKHQSPRGMTFPRWVDKLPGGSNGGGWIETRRPPLYTIRRGFKGRFVPSGGVLRTA